MILIFFFTLQLLSRLSFSFATRHKIEAITSDPGLLPYLFLITGIMVLSTKFIKTKNSSITYSKAFIIGLFQALAILPAISRSGGTIFSALILGLSPQNAFNFSFCLFIPATFGAIVLSLKDIATSNFTTLNNLFAFLTTTIVGYFVLNYFQKITINKKFWVFGVYTILLSVVLFFIL